MERVESKSNTVNGFYAILNFINALSNINDSKPLLMYKRFLDHITVNDTVIMNKINDTFTKFYNTNPQVLSAQFNIPRNSRIQYSDRVYVMIGEIYHKSSSQIKSCIKEHLLNIATLVGDASQIKKASELLLARETDLSNVGLDKSTKEGELVSSIIESATKSIEGLEVQPSTPNELYTTMVSSGAISNIFTTLMNNEDIQSGNLNPGVMLGMLQNMINTTQQQFNTTQQQFNNIKGGTTSGPIVEQVDD